MQRIYEGDRREARRQSTRRYRERDPERSREQWRQYKLRKILAKTGGREKPEVCDVCGSGGKICFDHDHKTDEFRGWLCNDCNMVLGKVKDSVERLRGLALYLERFSDALLRR